MSTQDKAENAAQKAAGKVKEAAGHLTDDDKLVAEGKTDQAKAAVKKAVEDVKDVFRG